MIFWVLNSFFIIYIKPLRFLFWVIYVYVKSLYPLGWNGWCTNMYLASIGHWLQYFSF